MLELETLYACFIGGRSAEHPCCSGHAGYEAFRACCPHPCFHSVFAHGQFRKLNASLELLHAQH